jgi:predicted GNAT family acetyltransferase
MQVRLHRSVDEFRAFAEPVYRRDPVVHTVELTALRSAPPSTAADGVLLTVWNAGVPVGAALQTPPYPLLCNGIPDDAMTAVAAELARARPALAAVRGMRTIAKSFAEAWCAVTANHATVVCEERLYRLARLRVPHGVPGRHRDADAADHALLVDWLDGFWADAGGDRPDRGAHGRILDDADRIGDRFLLWTVDGTPVSMAMLRAPAFGVSRIGPVFTPRHFRGHGYGSAVTAAAAESARRDGVDEVVLFADLANPVSNAIYQRIGFEPVCDSVRIDIRVP